MAHHHHHHHGHDEDEDEHEHHHHHHDHDEEDEDEHEHEHHHHHHDHDEEEEEHEHEHHHHHDHDEDEHEHHHHHHHHHDHEGHDADEIFESYGWTNVPPVTKQKLESILQELSENEADVILRSKGMIKAADADTWYYFDMVPGEYEIRCGEPDYTGKVCVIGSELDEKKLKALFF